MVSALQREGLIENSKAQRKHWRSWWIAALLPLAFIAGRWSAGAQNEDSPRASHLLLLYAGEAVKSMSAAQRRESFDAHAAWSQQLASDGQLLDANPISQQGWLIEKDNGETEVRPQQGLPINGYFAIRAGSDREALTLAQACPTLNWGGRVEVRRVTGAE